MASRKGWAIEKEIWQTIPSQITDNRWRCTQVTRTSSTQIPDSPGIYMFCVKQEHQGLSLQNPMYIGKAKNIKNRFKSHLENNERVKELKKCFRNKLEFYYLKLPDDTPDNDLRILEQSMIDLYGPQFNEIDSVAVSSPLRVTLGDPIEF